MSLFPERKKSIHKISKTKMTATAAKAPLMRTSSNQSYRTAGSAIPSYISLFLVACVFLFSNFRDFALYYISTPRAASSTTSGTLVWVTDGMHQLIYALPLFLASGITLATFPGRVRPIRALFNPERAVLVIQILVALANIWQATWTLVTVYVLAKPKKADWTVVAENVARRLAEPLYWNMAYLFYFAIRSPALSPLQASLGLAHEHVVKLHRCTGWWTTGIITVHGGLCTIAWIAKNQLDYQFRYVSPHGTLNSFGAFGAIALGLMAITSLPPIRRRFFTLFAMAHRLWPLFVFFSIMHVVAFTWPVLPVLALYIIDRIACLWTATPGPVGGSTVMVTAVHVSSDVVALLIPVGPARGTSDGDDDCTSTLDNELLEMYAPGRFLSLSFPLDAAHISHPFSIAAYSAPNRTVSIMIRAVGPWTRRLHATATEDGSPVVLRVEGPFSMPTMHPASAWGSSSSSSSSESLVESSESGMTVIAGGVGISKYLMHSDRASPLLASDAAKQSLLQRDDALTTTADSNSDDTAVAGMRKLWLCKDDAELAMYLAIGADLSDWTAYSRHGFAADLEDTGVRDQYPLYAQTGVAVPLRPLARVLLFTVMIGMYAGLYIVSRVTVPLPNAKYCAQKPMTLDRFMACTRWFGVVPYLAILVGLTVVVQLATLARLAVTARTRPPTTFRCHAATINTVPRALIERRFVADRDAPELVAPKVVQANRSTIGAVRVCAGRPVRELVRSAGSTSGVVVIDDGRLF